MVKNSALTLPVLVVLVLVGAGVVFLGPQLTGYQIGATAGISHIIPLYPLGVSDSDRVENQTFAVGGNNPDFAVFPAAWGNLYDGGRSGSSRCPPGFTFVQGAWSEYVGEFPVVPSCKFLDSEFFAWLATTHEFRSLRASAVTLSVPDDITSVKVKASITHSGPSMDYDSSSPYYVGGDQGHYRVFVRARCTGTTGPYAIRDLGECSIPLPSESKTIRQRLCSKSLGTATGSCPSGKWKVSQLIVGYSDVLRQPAFESGPIRPVERRQDLRVHWIRLNRV